MAQGEALEALLRSCLKDLVVLPSCAFQGGIMGVLSRSCKGFSKYGQLL